MERSAGATGTFAEIGETGLGITSYVDATVVDGTSYCYRVRAFNASAYSAYSNAACGSAGPAVGLAIVKMGAGSGTVISTPAGVICGSSCSGSFPAGTAVTLAATAAPGSVFTGWSGGGCSGAGPCGVSLAATTTITATFDEAPPVSLTVSLAGWARGTVTSSPAGVICGEACTASYPRGTVVTLTATSSRPLVPFAGWSGGGCAGTGPCTLTLVAPTTVTASWRVRP